MAKYNIGGYIFDDENSAKKAAKELKAVEYIIGQIKNTDENGVLTVYKKLLNQRMFSTEIGLGFLNQLRQNLVSSGAFDESEIPEVYTLEEPKAAEETESAEVIASQDNLDYESSAKTSGSKSKSNSIDAKYKRLKVINSVLLVICLTLLVCVCGMFYINSTINSPNILNYKETITDEFSSWKQELDQREKELNERERLIEEKENSVGDIDN